MNYVRCEDSAGRRFFGILAGDRIEELATSPFEYIRRTGNIYHLGEVHLLAPCIPSKIVGVGANYHSHLDQKKLDYPKQPKIFLKPATSVIGPGEIIRCPNPKHVIHFEGELAAVIGKNCFQVPAEAAMEYVFGFTCINDVTDRTMIEEDVQWTRAKGADTFAPMGPVIIDELDWQDCLLETRVNGEIRQKMSTADMYFKLPRLIEFISGNMTLCPGDVIATGSPAGIGPFYPGDTVEITIEKIGVLTNRME